MNDKTLVEQQFAALKKAHKDVVEKYCDLVLEKNQKTDTIEALQSRIEALEAALLPFARLMGEGVNMNDPLSKWVTIAQIADAHDALEGE